MLKWALNSTEHKELPEDSQSASTNSMREEMELSEWEETESESRLP